MSDEERSTSDTIINMITNLKPEINCDPQFDHSTPLKRHLSSNDDSTDESPVIKKLKPTRNRLDISYIGSPRELRRVRADLLEARNTIIGLENRVQQMHNLRKEMQQIFDEETRTLRQQHEHDRKSIEELESQLQNIRKRESEAKEELSQVKNKYDTLKIKMDEGIDELKKQLVDVTEELKCNTDKTDSELTDSRRKIADLENVLKAAEEDAEAQRQLAEELGKRLNERSAAELNFELKEQALQKANAQIKELEYFKESYLEFQQQSKIWQHKISTYSELEKENIRFKEEMQKLKDEFRKNLPLEEEVYDLKSRLVIFKEQEKKLAALQIAQVQNELQLEEWRAVARDICESTDNDFSLPQKLRMIVEKLQQQEINLTADKAQLESELNMAKHDLQVTHAELEKNEKHLAELNKNMQQKQTLFHRLQKKINLLTRERDCYRLQLDSYEKDLTMCFNPTSTSGPSTNPQLQSQRERIESLEKIVEEYRDMNIKLENDLQNVEAGSHTDAVPIRVEQNRRLQEEIEKLKAENEDLRMEKDRLEIRLEKVSMGESDLHGRVLHLAKNPLSDCLIQRENETKKLQEDNERLKRKIRDLEQGLDGSKLENISMSAKDCHTLKEEVKKLENQNQRLKDYFKSSMQEFRNVIYMLLGYKIDKTSNSQYKLTSMYAEHSEDQLCFQLNTEGALNLLENHFSSTLEDMVDLHLRHQKSIPVFLSALTIELFNNGTMATRTYEIE